MDVGTIIDEELRAFAARMAEEASAASARIRARIASEVMGLGVAAPKVAKAKSVTAETYKAPPPGRMTRAQVDEMRQAVTSIFRPGVTLAAGDVGDRLGLDRHRVTLALADRVKRKVLKASGAGRWRRYQLV